jgi:glycosyltransferase involved in cell wall biosynthesis
MRICFLGDGSSIHIQRWLSFFKSRGHEVHLITFSPVANEGITVHKVGNFDININGSNWQYLLEARAIKKLLKKIQPDIVNAHYITSYGLLAALSGYKPLVLSAWGSDILVTPNKSFVYRLITKYALSKASLITSDSLYMTEKAKDLTSKRIITVPMGVEETLIKLNRKANEQTKIISLRTINKNSNIDIIVKGFDSFLKRNKSDNAQLIIGNNGPELDNIKALVQSLGIESKVIFKGFMKREELLEELASSSIHISIPTSDATSVTLLEAMAVGLVSIVSDIPANREWIVHNKNGLIISELTPKALAEAISYSIESKSFSVECTYHSKKIIEERALWTNNMKEIENEYKSISSN